MLNSRERIEKFCKVQDLIDRIDAKTLPTYQTQQNFTNYALSAFAKPQKIDTRISGSFGIGGFASPN